MGELIRIQPLPKRFSLLTQVKGQYALDSLLSPAQFVFGSYPYGSGYEPAELGGDHGLAARAELRYGFDTSNIESIKLNNLLVYGFYDIGKAWNKDATSGPAGKSAASTGLGARLLVFDAIGMDFEVTKALTHGWRTRQVYSGNKKPWRFLFKLETRF
jgi:hemolysin activation/secretion protein